MFLFHVVVRVGRFNLCFFYVLILDGVKFVETIVRMIRVGFCLRGTLTTMLLTM